MDKRKIKKRNHHMCIMPPTSAIESSTRVCWRCLHKHISMKMPTSLCHKYCLNLFFSLSLSIFLFFVFYFGSCTKWHNAFLSAVCMCSDIWFCINDGSFWWKSVNISFQSICVKPCSFHCETCCTFLLEYSMRMSFLQYHCHKEHIAPNKNSRSSKQHQLQWQQNEWKTVEWAGVIERHILTKRIFTQWMFAGTSSRRYKICTIAL